jgi:DNA-binding response OmpR family regulator
MKIFILEDDADQAQLYKLWLEEHGHEVQVFDTGREFIRRIPFDLPDIALLDWNLPVIDGMDVLHWIKASRYDDIPVIFLSARADENDMVEALTQGADDYIAKPITQGELLARIAAVSRRYNKNQPKNLEDTSPYGIDPEEGVITLNNETVPLTAKEFDLCVHFFKNPGRLISRKNLLETIWVRRSDINTRTVDTHISRLRKKLQLDGSHGWKLISVYHQGYKMVREKRHVA